MQTVATGPQLAGKQGWYRAALHELTLSWHFIGGDLSSTIVPAVLFVGAAWSPSVSLGKMVGAIGAALGYFWLYIYLFCLANQLAGLEEDRANKPQRPLVAGRVSSRGAMTRWMVLMPIFTALGWALGVLSWTLLWQIAIVLHNFGSWHRRWYLKNLLMSVGIIAQLGAAWELVRPITPLAWQWIVCIAVLIFGLVSVQDLRDIAGDTLAGRRTAPIVFGPQRTRRVLAFGFVLLPLVVHRWLLQPAGMTVSAWLFDAAVAALSLTLAYRVLRLRTPRQDHRTYILFTYWYCLTLLSAVFVL